MIRKITDNAPTASKQGRYNDKSNGAREYFYDNNGSMTKDFDREVIVKYNLLNLPIVTQLTQKTISTTRYTKTVL